AAVDGQGVALARTALAAWDLIGGRLVRPFDAAMTASYAYWIVCSKAAVKLPKIVAFSDWLLAEAAEAARQPERRKSRSRPAARAARGTDAPRGPRMGPLSCALCPAGEIERSDRPRHLPRGSGTDCERLSSRRLVRNAPRSERLVLPMHGKPFVHGLAHCMENRERRPARRWVAMPRLRACAQSVCRIP